jgi:DNA recombination protein RmuC
MEWLISTLTLLVGLVLGWLGSAARAQAAAATARELREQRDRLSHDKDSLTLELRQATADRAASAERAATLEQSFNDQLKLLRDAEQRLAVTFKSLSAEALEANRSQFITLAGEQIGAVVSPVKESLVRMDEEIRDLEKARSQAYGHLSTQVLSLIDAQRELRTEAEKLSRALRAPSVRGRWGEIQLKRVVEMAGMLARCDFFTQDTASGDNGRLRPDLRIQLPGGKNIIVDAKAPLQAYLESLDASSEDARLEKLRQHAAQVRAHLNQLAAKGYWEQFRPAPEFVVMFLPGETFFSAALEQDSALIEYGVNQRVILATPTTLISLLRAVSYGWNQEQLAENAARINEAARELADRFAVMVAHLARMGDALRKSVGAYNDAIGSFEGRLMPAARKLKELGIEGKGELAALPTVDLAVRSPDAPVEVINGKNGK